MFCFRLSYKVVFLPFYTVVKDLLLAQSFRPHRKIFYFPMIPLPLQVLASRCLRTFVLVGLTGLEPVTLRLSSACSNQLSYRPGTSHHSPFLFFNNTKKQEKHTRSGGKGIRTPDL